MTISELKPMAIGLNKSRAYYQTLRDHFALFIEDAKNLAGPDSPVKEIYVSTEGDAVHIRFLNLSIRVRMEFTRDPPQGVLVAERITSQQGSLESSKVIARIPFNTRGETDLDDGYTGGNISLQLGPDRTRLALHIIDTALSAPA